MVFTTILDGLPAGDSIGADTIDGLLCAARAERRERDFVIGPGGGVNAIGVWVTRELLSRSRMGLRLCRSAELLVASCLRFDSYWD